jgi:N6-adenosine-specific RNA methylase IME4
MKKYKTIVADPPWGVMELFEKVSNAPYLELFSREKHLNWDVWGNEVESDIQLNIQGGTQSEA